MIINNRFAHLFLAGLVLVLLFSAGMMTAQAAGDPGQRISAPFVNWGGDCRYIVRPGDTLFRIGVRYGVSWWYLAQLNNLLNPNFIYVGMPLRVPCDGHAGKVPPRPPSSCSSPVTYLVKPGDNLFRIALAHHTTINSIRDANQLWGRVLRPGMLLTIPCPGKDAAAPPPVVPETAPGATQTPPPNESELLPEPSAVINLRADAIDPNTVTIKAGQTVVWINQSQTTYTLVGGTPGQPNDMVGSDALPPGATFVFRFDASGNYLYYVMENTTLIGQVNVSP